MNSVLKCVLTYCYIQIDRRQQCMAVNKGMELIVIFIVGTLLTPCLSLKLDVFSSKTLYEWAYPSTTPVLEESTFTHPTNGVCQAVHVYIVARHGARMPSDGTMEDIPGLFDNLRNHKDPSKFTGLDKWTNRYDIKEGSQLVQKGIDEHNELGQRLTQRFPRLFETHGSLVKFVSSYKTRASNSSKYFHQGMSQQINSLGGYVNEINNTLSRYYDGCYNYEHGVEDNATHMSEFHKYGNTSDFLTVKNALIARLGLNASLSEDEVYLIYEMCAYEKYIFGEDLWCSLLTDEERDILEYGQDLEKYYESGDTSPIITKMTCPLVQDIFNTMDSSKSDTWDYMAASTSFNNTRYLAGKFVFGHSETVVPLFTAFGLYKDSTPLLASNREAMQNRKFRTSHIVPFSANVAIAMYACDDPNNANLTRSFLVRMFVNEETVSIPACNRPVCSLEDFTSYYSPIVENCNLDLICGSEDDNNGVNNPNGAVQIIGTVLSFILPLVIVVSVV